MEESKVSVVVVSFNTQEKLARCLACIEPSHEVIVIENASADGSAEMVRDRFPSVRLVVNQSNVGFSAANNQGWALATRDLVLFLNSDAYAEPGAIDLLASEVLKDRVVAGGGKLLNLDGSLQQSTANELTLWAVFCEQTLLEKISAQSLSTAFRSGGEGRVRGIAPRGSPLFAPYWTTRHLASDDTVKETPQVMGACLMVRRKIDLRWDERYFLYCEDTDLCLRLSRLGRIVYVPDARFTHDLGSSSRKDPWKAIARYNAGKELYFRLHRGKTSQMLCFAMDRCGALLRLLGWTALLFVKAKARSQVATFWRVLTAPYSGPSRS